MFLEIKIRFSAVIRRLKTFFNLLFVKKNTLKGLAIILLVAFYEFICKYYLENFFFLCPNLIFFQKKSYFWLPLDA